jgi:hypothetical protein
MSIHERIAGVEATVCSNSRAPKKLKPASHTLPPMTPIALGDSMLATPMTLNGEAASMESVDRDVEEAYNLDIPMTIPLHR